MGEAEAIVYASVAFAADADKLVASQFGRFKLVVGSLGAPIDRKLGGPQRRSGRYGEEKNPLTPAGNQSTVSLPIDRPSAD
jgi:hypothetical protein